MKILIATVLALCTFAIWAAEPITTDVQVFKVQGGQETVLAQTQVQALPFEDALTVLNGPVMEGQTLQEGKSLMAREAVLQGSLLAATTPMPAIREEYAVRTHTYIAACQVGKRGRVLTPGTYEEGVRVRAFQLNGNVVVVGKVLESTGLGVSRMDNGCYVELPQTRMVEFGLQNLSQKAKEIRLSGEDGAQYRITARVR